MKESLDDLRKRRDVVSEDKEKLDKDRGINLKNLKKVEDDENYLKQNIH